MQSSKLFLETCYALALKGCWTEIKGDRRIARGFADLGYEEFLLLNNKRTVSLYTGTNSELPEAHRAFFFTVPTLENVIDEILQRDFEIASAIFENQRRWQIVLRYNDRKSGETTLLPMEEDAEFETALVRALLAALSLEKIG